MTMRIRLGGETFDVTAELVRLRLDNQVPEAVRDYWVEVDGTRWPVKQVISLATGVTDRKRFQSRDSRRCLSRLGFTVGSDSAGAFNLESLVQIETVDLRVAFNWLDAGWVGLDPLGVPSFPALPQLPGLYRYDFGTGPDGTRRLYVGESKNLSDRASQYRKAKRDRARLRTSRRIHKELVAHLSAGGSVGFAIATSARLGDGGELDLRFKSARCLAENAAVVLARSQPHVRMLNIDAELGGDDAGPVA
jgi:hypothetical protein